MMIPLKLSTRWLSIAYAMTSALFCLPVVMLFYGYKGLTMGDFFFIQGVANVSIFLTVVPSGYVSDLFSRKNTLIISFLCWIAGDLIWIFGSGFVPIMLGELIFGLAIAFASGTLEAYFYDLLKKRHKEYLFHIKYAKMKTLSNVVMAISSLTGAFIYQHFGPTTPLWLTVFCLMGAVVIVSVLPDVPESRRIVAQDKSKWQDVLDISKYALKHKQLKWLMLFPAIYSTLTLVLMWGLQSVMVVKNVPVFMFGFVVFGVALTRILFSASSGRILEKIQLSGIIKLLCLLIVVASLASCVAVYLPMWAVYICLVVMILGAASVSLSNISTSVLINHRIKSDERATILSVASMISRAMQGIGLICLKPLFDYIGVGSTFTVSSLLLSPILICASQLYKMKLKMIREM